MQTNGKKLCDEPLFSIRVEYDKVYTTRHFSGQTVREIREKSDFALGGIPADAKPMVSRGGEEKIVSEDYVIKRGERLKFVK